MGSTGGEEDEIQRLKIPDNLLQDYEVFVTCYVIICGAPYP